MKTPDPPNDNSEALKQVVLTPHDIPRILRVPKTIGILAHENGPKQAFQKETSSPIGFNSLASLKREGNYP